MEKTYKRVPFDIELAKKIQAGKVEGRIVTLSELSVRIVCFDVKNNFEYPLLALVEEKGREGVYSYTQDGTMCCGGPSDQLFIELPEETPKHEFKPFDKVLVTQTGWSYWIPSLYRNMAPDGHYICIDNYEYDKCIPYDGNEDLFNC